MDLLLAAGQYETYDDVFDDVQTLAMAEAFALRIHRSQGAAPYANHESGQKYLRFNLSCICAGVPRSIFGSSRSLTATITTLPTRILKICVPIVAIYGALTPPLRFKLRGSLVRAH